MMGLQDLDSCNKIKNMVYIEKHRSRCTKCNKIHRYLRALNPVDGFIT